MIGQKSKIRVPPPPDDWSTLKTKLCWAIDAGDDWYLPSRPCAFGHTAPTRATRGGGVCYTCALEMHVIYEQENAVKLACKITRKKVTPPPPDFPADMHVYDFETHTYRTCEYATSRAHAEKSKEEFFQTWVPCTNGHITKRYRKSGSCVQCVENGLVATPTHVRIDNGHALDEIKNPAPVRTAPPAPVRTAPPAPVRTVKERKRKPNKKPAHMYADKSPCRHGHPPLRYVSTRHCFVCVAINNASRRARVFVDKLNRQQGNQ